MIRHFSVSVLLRSSFVLAGLFLSQFFAFSNPALAQGPPLDPSTAARFADVKIGVGDRKNVLVNVFTDLKAHLDRQAVIKLHDQKRDFTVWQTTDSESLAEFHDLDFGDYDVEISAFGYLPDHQVVHVTTTPDPSIQLKVVLKRTRKLWN